MHLLRRAALALALVATVLTSSAFAYQFFFAKELEKTLPEHVGKQVKVVDKLVKIYEHQEIEGFFKFDTYRFRCVIPASETEGIAFLRELLAKQEGADGQSPDGREPLVAIYGTVTNGSKFWSPGGKEPGAGTAEDQIVIAADRVEKPRDRFHEEGY